MQVVIDYSVGQDKSKGGRVGWGVMKGLADGSYLMCPERNLTQGMQHNETETTLMSDRVGGGLSLLTTASAPSEIMDSDAENSGEGGGGGRGETEVKGPGGPQRTEREKKKKDVCFPSFMVKLNITARFKKTKTKQQQPQLCR